MIIDFSKRVVIPRGSSSRTKRAWVTFYNEEAEKALKEYLGSFDGLDKDEKLFQLLRLTSGRGAKPSRRRQV